MKRYNVILIQADKDKYLHHKFDDKLCTTVQLLDESDLSNWEEISK
jgi:hypothetical protein